MATAQIAEDIARKVAHAMVEADASKNRLAQQTGIPYSTLGRKLKGRTEFTFSELLLIAEALGVDPATFLPDTFAASAVA